MQIHHGSAPLSWGQITAVMRGHVQVIPDSINKEPGILARMREAADLFKGWHDNRAEGFFKGAYGESKNKSLKHKKAINWWWGGGENVYAEK